MRGCIPLLRRTHAAGAMALRRTKVLHPPTNCTTQSYGAIPLPMFLHNLARSTAATLHYLLFDHDQTILLRVLVF